jgi:F-type H+-transporting ATPase subunit delta
MAKLKDRYANALLELSEEKGTLEKDIEQATFIRDIFRNSDVQAFLLNPHFPDSAKHQLFHNAFLKNLSNHLMGFLYHMVGKSRESLIVPALTEYIKCSNRRLGKIEAKVVSAKALTEKQVEFIRTLLSQKLHMQVEVKAAVDPNVIGGFYVLVNGYIFDRTVRTDLNDMKERLKRGNVNDR